MNKLQTKLITCNFKLVVMQNVHAAAAIRDLERLKA